MKALLLLVYIILSSTVMMAQKHDILKIRSKSGNTIHISFKKRFASIEVRHDSLVTGAFEELKGFMKEVGRNHMLCRIYPLFVISPQSKYYTYPLNRNKLIKDIFQKTIY